ASTSTPPTRHPAILGASSPALSPRNTAKPSPSSASPRTTACGPPATTPSPRPPACSPTAPPFPSPPPSRFSSEPVPSASAHSVAAGACDLPAVITSFPVLIIRAVGSVLRRSRTAGPVIVFSNVKAPPAITPNRQRGFALLITITLVAFLVLILVGLATLTRVETQVAANSQLQTQARQNALMALNIALGQLQKHTGPDQRVTARADIILPASATVTPPTFN